jgi:hypothetical protein
MCAEIALPFTTAWMNICYLASYAVARMGEGRGVFVGKPEGRRPFGRPRRRWEDNIKADLLEVGCGVWTGLSWLRIETGGGHL